MKCRRSKQVLWLSATICVGACASGEEADTMDMQGNPAESGDGDTPDVGDDDVGDGDVGDGDVGDGDIGDGDVGDGDVGDGDDTPGDPTAGGELEPALDCTADEPEAAEDLITNFEDGTVGVNPVEGRGGGFYVFNDKDDAMAQPFAVEAMNRCEDGSSLYAFCTQGSGFTVWGAGFGTDLGVLDPDTMTKASVDLSAYRGIAFWLAARAGSKAPVVKVMLPDVNTAAEGGKCTTDGAAEKSEQCDPFVKNVPVPAEWTRIEVSFDDLRQGGWGKRVEAFAKEAVFGIQLQFPAGAAFDVCFDQLVLLR